MKRSTIITITIIAYLVALLGMFFGVDQYVKSKDQRLSEEIHKKIGEIFAGRNQYVDVLYSGCHVEYEEMQIPEHNPSSIFNRVMPNSWSETYGDLISMYRIDCNNVPYSRQDGWNLVVVERDYGGVFMTTIFPYAVGYLKQNRSLFSDLLSDYVLSVPSAVDAAFKFYTTNKKSDYYGCFEEGCLSEVLSQMNDAANEYYYLSGDEHPRWHDGSGIPLFEEYPTGNNTGSYQKGFMYNGFYKVFIAASQPQTYTIKKYDWNPDEKDRKDLWLYWSIGLTALMLIIVIPLAFIQRKHDKERDESLYDKLKRLCNPANFISSGNYDKEKVDKANEIYKKLLDISPDNKEALDAIQQQAITDLGICLINQDKLNELKEKVNPKKYLNPYNAEKVALANELFAILSKEGLTYNELAEVEERSKSLHTSV